MYLSILRCSGAVRTMLRWACAGSLLIPTAVGADSLQVLHWWKSASERKALEILAQHTQAKGTAWVTEDAGDGVGAAIILRNRILVNDIPDVAQANSDSARNWMRLGLLAPLDAAAAAGHWNQRLLPAVARIMQPDGHMLGVPLGIHRLNTLFYNHRVFTRLNLAPPLSWGDFERVASSLQRAGIVPMVQSSEPWQLAILFENLILAEGGVALHHRLYARIDDSVFHDPATARALLRLRDLKRWMLQPIGELPWPQAARQFGTGKAAMLIGGDWIKGELQASGMMADQVFSCTSAPGTAGVYVYDIDTLLMLKSARAPNSAQKKVAQIAMEPALQERYNQAKGSVSVLRSADPRTMDSCARASWTLFASSDAILVPSQTLGVTGEDVARDEFAAQLHLFFMDDAMPVQEVQRRLAALGRAYNMTRLP